MQTMKLDPKTVSVLKNFSSINPSILFKEGSELRTISPTKNILAKAKVNQEFESQFAIYDLSRFLGVLSLFDNPDLNVNEKFVTIKDGQRKLNYTFADASAIIVPPDKDINLEGKNVAATVEVTSKSLDDVLKGLAVLRLPELAFVADGYTVALQAIDTKNPSSDVYSVDLGPTDKTFKAVFKAENIKILPGDYAVTIYPDGIAAFAGTDVDYWIAMETSSNF